MSKPTYWLRTLEPTKLEQMLNRCESAIDDNASVVSFSEFGSSINFIRVWNPIDMADWIVEEQVFRGIKTLYSNPIKGATLLND